MYETWYKMTQMLRSGLNVSKVLTHKMSMEQYNEAFNIMESGDCGKIVLEW
jgi:threonine 3-dehydrogenase